MKEGKIIDVSSGICPLGPSNKVKAAIRKAAKDINNRPDAAIARLERLFSSKFGVLNDRIIFANSVREVVTSIMRALGPKRVLIAGPAPRLYEESASKIGAEALYLGPSEGSGFAADADKIIRGLDGVDLVFIANPNRISGRSVDGATLFRVIEISAQKNLSVVIDESFIEFTGGDGFDHVAAAGRNVITIRTTAHFYGLPGLELAYAVSDQQTIRQLRKVKDCSLNVLSVEAARTALKDKTYGKLARLFIAEEKELLAKELGKVAGVTFYGSDSNVYLVKVERPGERIMDSFLRAGLLIRDCSDIAGLGNSFLRLSVMSHDMNLKLLRLMKTLVPPSVSPTG
jgi:threonine-phosphate decarboxylase